MNYGGTLFLWTVTALSFHNQCFIWWEITRVIMPIKVYHTSDDAVVRKRSDHRTPPSIIRHNVTCSTSQCALIVQKYAQAVRFRIPIIKCKNFLWKFRFLISTSLTPVIIQIWRLIFVLEPIIHPSGKRIEICITCDQVLSND